MQKEKHKDQESINQITCLTQTPYRKVTNHTQESQQVIPFPACKEQKRQYDRQTLNTPQKERLLGMVSKI